MKAAVMVLSAAYPGASSYPDLLGAVRQLMADYGVPDSADEPAYREALFQLVVTHGVMPTVWTGPAAAAAGPGERPAAHSLARQQANSPGWVVSGARHVAIDLDPPGRMLLGLLDGSRTIDELTAQMRATLAQSGVDMPLERLSELTWQQVWLFACQGLLMA
jgi:hypothetical protein